MDKDLYGYISIFFTIAAYVPYVWSTWKGQTRPHIFSWVIWSVLMAIASAGQFAGHAGPGTWASIGSAAFCMLIAAMALRHGEKEITRHDALVFIGALAALPLWYITSTPLTAILVVTFMDLMGYIPTMRKAWHRPREEYWLHYAISNLKHIFAICAMTQYSLTTTLYPAALFFMNGVLIALIIWREKVLKTA